MPCKYLGLIFVLALPLTVQPTDELRADLFRRINDLRATGKVAALVRNGKLDAAAQKHAENMARQDKFGDEGKTGHILDGKGAGQRLKAEGYQSLRTGENVAFISGTQSGQKAVERAVDMWVKSASHYKNIMDDKFDETGVGLAQSQSGKWYYCQTFGKSQEKRQP